MLAGVPSGAIWANCTLITTPQPAPLLVENRTICVLGPPPIVCSFTPTACELGMMMAEPTSLSLSALIRKALQLGAELGLSPENIDRLSSLYYKVGAGHLLAEQALANRETDLARALSSQSIDEGGLQILILEVEKLRRDVEARTSAGLEALHAALPGEQFLTLLTATEASINSGGEANVENAVNKYLDEKIKGKDVVEIEVATKAADRLYNWTKLFGFFVAAPVAAIMFGLSIFGITKVADVSTFVANSEKQLHDVLEKANKGAKEVDDKLAELKTQTDRKLVALQEQNNTLESKVKGLEKCIYGNDVRDVEATRSALQAKMVAFEST
jgi:hypothetical protein